MLVFATATAGAGFVAAWFDGGFGGGRAGTYGPGIDPTGRGMAAEFGFFLEDVLVVGVDVVSGELDVGKVGLGVRLVGVNFESRPADGGFVGQLNVGFAGGAGVGAVEMCVVSGHVRGETRAHEFFSGGGGTHSLDDGFAAKFVRFATAAGAGLSSLRGRKGGGKFRHYVSPKREAMGQASLKRRGA